MAKKKFLYKHLKIINTNGEEMGNISFTQGIYNYSDSLLHKLDPEARW